MPELVAVVTTTFLAPAVPAGVCARIEVDDATTMLVAALAPMVTPVMPLKFDPVITMEVPPLSGPVFGLTELMVGTLRYVNEVAAVPPAVMTKRSTMPAVELGVKNVICVAELERRVATLELTVTIAPLRLAPTSVTVVPPVNGPEVGLTEIRVGSAT